jgi:DNA-binding NtrC family response regulator
MRKSEDAHNEVLKVCAFTPNASTRFMLEISLKPNEYDLSFAETPAEALSAARENNSHIFLIDVAKSSGEAGKGLARNISSMAVKHMLRLVLLVDEPQAAEANQMQSFGPLFLLEFNFNRQQLNKTLRDIMLMSGAHQKAHDTGSRVKSDPKFYNIKRFID